MYRIFALGNAIPVHCLLGEIDFDDAFWVQIGWYGLTEFGKALVHLPIIDKDDTDLLQNLLGCKGTSDVLDKQLTEQLGIQSWCVLRLNILPISVFHSSDCWMLAHGKQDQYKKRRTVLYSCGHKSN